MRSQVTIGISGVQARVGCTHTCIMMANFLRGKGYKVALVEINDSGAFEDIRSASNSKLSLTKFFRYNDIDYYPYFNKMILKTIMNKEYQFVIIDFGYYVNAHKPAFCNCDASIFVCGTKSWEINNLNNVFEDIDQDSLRNYYFYFTFATNNEQIKNDIRTGMDYVENNLFFPPYVENPFTQGCFPGLKTIISGIVEKNAFMNRKGSILGRSEEILGLGDTLSTLMEDKPLNKANTNSQGHNEEADTERLNSKQVPKITEIENDFDEKQNQDSIKCEEKMNDTMSSSEELTEDTIITEQPTVNQSNQINDSLFNNSGFTEIKDPEADTDKDYKKRNYEIERNAKSNFRNILIGDNSPIKKVAESVSKEFNIRNFTKDNSKSNKGTFRKYEYTAKQAATIVSESREGMRKIKFIDVDNKDLLVQLSADIFNNTFCIAVRSGMECREKISKKTGIPILSVKIDGKDIFCGKEEISNIFGDEFKEITLIKESEE